MALPSNVTTGTVTGQFVDFYGNPCTGYVIFTADASAVLDTTTKTILLPEPIEVALDATGTLPATTLAATNSPNVNPQGFTYLVDFRLSQPFDSFHFSLPAGQSVDLSTLAPVPAYQGSPTVVGPVGPAGPKGATGAGVPLGGGTGQLLAKTANTDLATTWRSIVWGDITFLGPILARTPDLLIVGAVTRDANETAISAPVVWPDGTPGTYTALTVSTAFPGSVDSYSITYGNPVTRTYTQPTVTRDASGATTNVPAITVS